MQIAIENFFNFSNPSQWNCSIHNISEVGDVTLVVTPCPPSRSRLHIILQGVIYYDAYTGWNGASVNIATEEEWQGFIPQLGQTTLNHIGLQMLHKEYKLYLIPTSSGKNNVFVGKNAGIETILP